MATGKVVAVGDEWIVSDQAFALDPTNTAAFVVNTAGYFTGGGPGNFLVYSNKTQLQGTQFQNTMIGAGHTITVNPSMLPSDNAGLEITYRPAEASP